MPHALRNGLQGPHRRIQPIRQIPRIALQIRQGLARHATIHRGLGNSGRNARNQPRVKGIGDDVFRTEAKRLARPRAGDFFWHIFPRQHGQRFSRRNLHRVINGGSAHIKRTTENEGKAQNIINLVRVIRTSRRDNAIGPRVACLIRCDFRIRIGHGENDRLWRHGPDHLRRQRTLHGKAEKHIRTIQSLRQRTRRSGHGMRGFPLIHAFLTATPDHALGVTQDHVFGPHAHCLHQFSTGDGSRTRAIDDKLRRLQIAPSQMAGIDKPSDGDNGSAMLVVMEYRNIHQFAQALFDHKAFWCLDVFQIDATESWAQIAHGIDESVRVFGIHAKINRIHIGKALEQSSLAFHHRL